MDHAPPIRIAPELIDVSTLRGVIEEFVTRDGTETTDVETKIAEVLAHLRGGKAELWFDPVTRSCNIRSG